MEISGKQIKLLELQLIKNKDYNYSNQLTSFDSKI